MEIIREPLPASYGSSCDVAAVGLAPGPFAELRADLLPQA